MGSTQALGYAEAVADGLIRLEGALAAHLQYNFFPALPVEYVKPLAEALEAVAADEPGCEVALPEGLNPLPRQAYFSEDEGCVVVSAIDLVRACQAWPFLDLLPTVVYE